MDLEDDWTVIDKDNNINDSLYVPNDILLSIFSFLKFDDLCRITRVCKRWNRLSSKESLWKNLYLSEYPEPEDVSMTWKNLYFQKKNRIILSGSGNSICLVLDHTVFVSTVPKQISGIIVLRLTSPTPVYGLYLSLKGSEVGYKMKADGKAAFATHDYFHHLKAIKGKTPWLKSSSFTLDAGNYSIPFSFAFPLYGDHGEQLQPTFYSNGRHKVSYSISVCLNYKNWFSDLKDTKSLLVVGHYDVQHELGRLGTPQMLQKAVSLIGSGTMAIRVKLPTSVYVIPADANSSGTIPISIDVINESNSTVHKVSAWLVRKTEPEFPEKFSYNHAAAKYNIMEFKSLPESVFPVTVNAQSRQMQTSINFPLNIRNIVPSIRYAKLFRMSYRLHVKVHLSYLLVANPVFVFPVTLISDS